MPSRVHPHHAPQKPMICPDVSFVCGIEFPQPGQLSTGSSSRAINNHGSKNFRWRCRNIWTYLNCNLLRPQERIPFPSRNAHASIAITTPNHRSLARSNSVRPFHFHQLHRSLQSLHRRSPYKGWIAPLLLAARSLTLFFLLDLRVFAAYFRLARRSTRRKLGFCGWFFSVVGGHHRHWPRSRIFLAVRVASIAWRRRICRLSFLLKNHLPSLS